MWQIGHRSQLDEGIDGHVRTQALIYFGLAVGAAAFGVSLLVTRYVRRDPQAVRSGGAFAFFAGCMFLFALGAATAGWITARDGQ
jgi:hypothetical protein